MAKKTGGARSCEMCLSWSVLYGRRICHGCEHWKYDYPARGVCPRCQHEAHLNAEGLCKSCLQAIRVEDDAEWALAVLGARPRALQLTIGTYRHYATQARKIVRGESGGRGVNARWRRTLSQQCEEPAGAVVLEPQMWGQLPLFTLPRTLTDATVRAIATRTVSGWDQAQPVLETLTAERHLTRAWYYRAAKMVRLALALREADGIETAPETLLRDLPTNGDTVCLVLLRADLLAVPQQLGRAGQPQAPDVTSVPNSWSAPRQCSDCQAWMPGRRHAGFLCDPCRYWRERQQPGDCTRCHRSGLPVRAGYCRTCHPHRDADRARPTAMATTQLVVDLTVDADGQVMPLQDDELPPIPADVPPGATVCSGQEILFTMRRDWLPVLARLRSWPPGELPLTDAAAALVEDFAELRRNQQTSGFRKNIRTLAILGYWLGVENAVHERDVHDLARLDTHLAAKPVCQFLRARGLLVDDPELHQDSDLAWIETALHALPQRVADEVRARADILRGQGPRENEPRSWYGIRRYLTILQPTLTAWTAAGITTLREVTPDHLQDALENLAGTARRQLATSLRSLFRALKRKRLVFHDPARHLAVGDLTGTPRPVPSDLLTGLLDHAATPFARLTIALAAIHAVPATEIRTARTADLNLARGTLELRRGLLRHTLYLEELTHRLAADWLTYRHQRWPASANPYLLVSQKTALDPDHPAVHRNTLQQALPKGLTFDRLRQDRILDEAFTVGDPLKLMRLFGITERTAMRYAAAAYPERTARLPR
ncbi:hypothetical protein ACFCYB_34745 [Streptomyces sp. NPDC056309]|uniref:hypothetical protein n=1 Tax=unclassified Streptomyces TaxID=2593676 RepID=UPI0035DA7782